MNDEKKPMIKKVLNFLVGCFGLWMILVLAFLFDRESLGILTLMLTIPIAIIGPILWACYRKSNKPLALGFLVGGLLPFSYLFFMTGGCGIFI